MKRNIIVIIGFSMFLSGFISLVLALVGLDLQILAFLNKLSPLYAFIVKILLVFVGMMIFYIGRTGMFLTEDQ